MRCKRCGTENDTDARFCKKCGSDLAGKTIQPATSQTRKPGGFYRFCLAAAGVWTCFLLGSFVAIGMGMVSHGVSEPTVFGIGFGLGFVFFAGLWFVGTVVLLLLAMATRPTPPVSWPTSTKAGAVVIAVIALFWPIFKAAKVPPARVPATSSGTTGPASGASPATGGDPWTVRETASPMDGSKTVVLSNDSENEIDVWLGSKRPTLIVRCQEGKTDAYVVTGTAANVEYDTDTRTVRVRFDAAPPVTQRWGESTDHEALFAPNGKLLAKKMLTAKTLVFQFTPFNASPATAKFNVSGLERHLGQVAKACGWEVAGETGGESAPQSTTEGEATVISWPQGASVSIDGGEAIDSLTPVTLTALTPGTHRIRIVKAGYQPQEVRALIKAGETADIEVTLAKEQE